MQNWINKQNVAKLAQWSESSSAVPNSEIWVNAEKHLEFITVKANTLRAVKVLDWKTIFAGQTDQVVVDLGCGTGWLSAYLSTFPEVGKIYCVDSDEQMLRQMVPRMFELMSGNLSKTEQVHGLFEPILLENESVDLLVASSAFHHSEDLPGLLRECRRVLKPNGALVILNENPLSKRRYLYIWARKIAHMTFKILTGHVDDRFQKLSHVGILYDPMLGDWDYSRVAWYAYFNRAGFRFEEIDTGMGCYNFRKNRHTLKHFICRRK